jgi:hypothetical protein
MKTITSIISIILLITCLGFAQEKEEKATPYWYVSYAKIEFTKMDTLLKFRDEYIKPVIAEAKKQGMILDNKLLLHHTGSEYTAVFMTKFPSWCAMEKSWMNDALKKIEPDKDKRKAFWDAQWYILGDFIHYDEIYTEP